MILMAAVYRYPFWGHIRLAGRLVMANQYRELVAALELERLAIHLDRCMKLGSQAHIHMY